LEQINDGRLRGYGERGNTESGENAHALDYATERAFRSRCGAEQNAYPTLSNRTSPLTIVCGLPPCAVATVEHWRQLPWYRCPSCYPTRCHPDSGNTWADSHRSYIPGHFHIQCEGARARARSHESP